MSDARIESERLFHNRRYGGEEDPRAHLDGLYLAVRRCNDLQEALVRRLGAGAAVLEFGCADGALALDALETARFAARFEGIDISDDAVAKANARAARMGLAGARFHAMNAEALDFPDASFDLVYGRGILHHLDLDRACGEIARVLRPGGRAVFTEPMGHNPLINLYRRMTPALRTPDEHPLLARDIALARRRFSRVEARFFGLATLASLPFRGTPLHGPAERATAALDRVLLSVPGLRLAAWFVLLDCTR
jgi:SAM-dependent methyltransferase